jgi:hypothetical protein
LWKRNFSDLPAVKLESGFESGSKIKRNKITQTLLSMHMCIMDVIKDELGH